MGATAADRRDPAKLAGLGLLEPFDDLVDHRQGAWAVIPLVGRRLEGLTDHKAAALTQATLPVLFAAWGGLTAAAVPMRPTSSSLLARTAGR